MTPRPVAATVPLMRPLAAVDSSLDDPYTLLAPLVAIEAAGAPVALRRSAAALALTLGVVVPGER
jgi:hypothetical protein